MKKRVFLWVLLFAVIACGLFFYISHTKTIDSDKEIAKIGVVLPLTGDRAVFGMNSKKGLDLAVHEINASDSSSIHIELVVEDSRGKSQVAVSAFNKLVNEGIGIVVGPISSQEVLAIAPIAQSKQVILFSPGASSPEITHAGDFIIRNVPSDIYEASLMAEFAYDTLRLRKVAILYNNTDYGVGVENVFRKRLLEKGGDVYSLGFPPDLLDFKSYLHRIKEYKPDALYFVGYTELGTMIKQAKEMGFSCQFLTTAIFEDQSILNVASNAAEGIVFTSITFDVNNPSPRAKRFVEMYNDSFNEQPDGYAAVAYDAIHIIYDAMIYCKTHGGSIKDALYKTKDFPALLGSLSFDEYGDVVLPISLKTVKNKTFVNY